MSCGVGHRCGLDLALLWRWHRIAAAAPGQSLAWELPYAMGVALQRQKKKVPVVMLMKRNYLNSTNSSRSGKGIDSSCVQWVKSKVLGC